MENKNKLMILLILAVFIVCIGVGSYSYAKYLTKTKNDTTASFARWYITLNGEDINSTKNADIEIVQEHNDNIADGVIAPTSIAYFDLDVDANETDVDLEYTISITAPDNSAIRDFSIYKMVDKVTNAEVYATSAELTGTMKVLNEDGTRNTNKKIQKKVYIQWVDDDTKPNHMTDAEDTEASQWIEQSNGDETTTKVKKMGIVNVSITFRQIASS